MKKILLFSAVASVLLASCTKVEHEMPNVNEVSDRQIAFEAPIVSPSTKAGIHDGTTYNKNNTTDLGYTFGVVALWHENAWSDATDFATLSQWIGTKNGSDWNAVEVVKEQSGDYWSTSGKTYYWPKNGNLRFQAYSPFKYGASNTALPAVISSTGVKITDYTIPEESVNGDCVDVMYSEAQSISATSAPEAVSVLFKHALAQVCVNVSASVNDADIAVTSITLNNVNGKGSFNQGATTQWDVPAGQTLINYVLNSGKSVNDTETEFGKCLIIPQDFGTTELTIVYTQNSVSNTITKTFSDMLPTMKYNNDNTSYTDSKFKVGHKYTINVLFDMKEIKFSPSVDDWTEILVTY